MVIHAECNYMTICDYLGVPLEYGLQATPKYGTWMLQMEATLMKFFSRCTSYLFKIVKLRTAFNACGYLTFCDETLVSLGHRISIINDYASVHNLPNEKSSADSSLSSGEKGKSSPSTSRDTQDSAEDTEITEQPQGAVANVENVNENKNSPPNDSEPVKNKVQNLKPVIEYEDVSGQIEVTNEEIQEIVSLRFKRDEIDEDTLSEILQKLNPTVVLEDVNKDK